MPLFNPFSSFFYGNNPASSSSRQARRAALDSTFDAFSLPTTDSRYADGPSLGAGVNDGMTESDASSPGPSRRASTAYPYPPSDSYHSSSNMYPPLSHTVHRLRKALADTFPELLETLNSPADPRLLATFEHEIGCPLPPPVREMFLTADGQDLDSKDNGLFYGLFLLPLDEVIREWNFWRQAEHDPEAGQNPALLATMASIPPQWIKPLYACRGWIPLLSDRSGNYVGVDLDPDQGGSWGQVIVFGRDFDRKSVLWRGDGEGGWGKWLAGFVDDLESGDGWEADKSTSSSDEEEEVGYGSYNGGGQSGETGRGLKLAGEYAGWNVLEAWWDRSVRQWEQLGLGMDVEDIERGLQEARRLTGMEEGENEEVPRMSGNAAQVDIPVIASPTLPPMPSTPIPGDSEVLLPPSSPEGPHQPRSKAPVRIITPVASTSSHPLQSRVSDHDLSSGFLNPRDARRRKAPPPAPNPLDLPTRADVQAMAAIAQAEASGLRGGWVMNIDASGSRRPYRSSSEMVDIDLEGGRGEQSGHARTSAERMRQAREEEKAVLAGFGRTSPLISTRTPSPLSRDSSVDILNGALERDDKTPKPILRTNLDQSHVPSTYTDASPLQPPPPIASSPPRRGRVGTPEEDRDVPVQRHIPPPRRFEREASVVSTDSQDGLLSEQDGSVPENGQYSTDFTAEVDSSKIKNHTPDTHPEIRTSHEDPRKSAPRKGKGSAWDHTNGLEDAMEEVSLDVDERVVPNGIARSEAVVK